MGFTPEEILLTITEDCNLSCPHCTGTASEINLSALRADKFLKDCKKIGIERIGFTGGEPFLAANLLCELVESSIKDGLLFDKIMTNGVWHKDGRHLKSVLSNLFASGYDGNICVSVDAFHCQNLRKLAAFIKTVLSIWRRGDMISIACVRGARDYFSRIKLKKLSGLLNSRLAGFNTGNTAIKGKNIFIRVHYIELSPIGKAAALKDPWDGKWFKEDHCKGPGNVFFVTASGDVKPCCGYANDMDMFTIGNIKKDSPQKMMKNFRENRYLRAIFDLGLARIRKKLEICGVVFPGKTTNHCFFCDYIFNNLPTAVLDKCIN